MKDKVTVKYGGQTCIADKIHPKGIIYQISILDTVIGRAVMDVDGFYYFEFPETEVSYWSGWEFTILGKIMKKLNKPYEDELTEYFKNNPQPDYIEPEF